jgi:hypothetical protein
MGSTLFRDGARSSSLSCNYKGREANLKLMLREIGPVSVVSIEFVTWNTLVKTACARNEYLLPNPR